MAIARQYAGKGEIGFLIKLLREYKDIPKSAFGNPTVANLIREVEKYPAGPKTPVYEKNLPGIIKTLQKKYKGNKIITPGTIKSLLNQASENFLKNHPRAPSERKRNPASDLNIFKRSEARSSGIQISEIARLDARIIRGDFFDLSEIRLAAARTYGILASQGTEVDAFLKQVENALFSIAPPGAGHAYISQEAYEREVKAVLDALRVYFSTHPNHPVRLALSTPEGSPLETRENLRLYQENIEHFAGSLDQLFLEGNFKGESADNLLDSLRTLHIRFSQIRRWGEIKTWNGEVVPVLSPDILENDFGNQPFFGIGMKGRSRDPRAQAFGALLQFALGIILAHELEGKAKILIQPDLLKAEVLKASTFLRLNGWENQLFSMESRNAQLSLEGIESFLGRSLQASLEVLHSA